MLISDYRRGQLQFLIFIFCVVKEINILSLNRFYRYKDFIFLSVNLLSQIVTFNQSIKIIHLGGYQTNET